jgi:hypothetical protein
VLSPLSTPKGIFVPPPLFLYGFVYGEELTTLSRIDGMARGRCQVPTPQEQQSWLLPPCPRRSEVEKRKSQKKSTLMP